jgi:hypothetical protein
MCIALEPHRAHRTEMELSASFTSNVGPQIGHFANFAASSRGRMSDHALLALSGSGSIILGITT